MGGWGGGGQLAVSKLITDSLDWQNLAISHQ